MYPRCTPNDLFNYFEQQKLSTFFLFVDCVRSHQFGRRSNIEDEDGLHSDDQIWAAWIVRKELKNRIAKNHF